MVQGKGSITGCDLGCVTFTIMHKLSMSHLEAGIPLCRGGLWKVLQFEVCVCMCVYRGK